jgi:hypothetical protein
MTIKNAGFIYSGLSPVSYNEKYNSDTHLISIRLRLAAGIKYRVIQNY